MKWADDDPVGVLAGCGLLLLIALVGTLLLMAVVVLARAVFA